MTVSQDIDDILKEIRENKEMMDAKTGADKLRDLSVLHAYLTSIIADRNKIYHQKFEEIMNETVNDKPITVSRAKVKAEASEEYYQLDKAIKLEVSLMTTIQSLKLWVRIRQGEEYNSNNLQ